MNATTEPHSRSETYIEIVERSIGHSLRPEYVDDIDLAADDCIAIRDSLLGFYTEHPFSSACDPDPEVFSPVFTSDISNLRDSGDSLVAMAQAFDTKQLTPSANKISNLFLFARRTILSDPLVAFANMLEDDFPDRMTDEDIIETMTQQIRAVAHVRELIMSETICFYYPAGHWLAEYEKLSEEMAMEVGLSSLPAFEKWAEEEIVPNEGLEDHMATWGTMAMMEIIESLSFCKLLGRNCGPVLASDLAMDAYEALLASFPAHKSENINDLRNAARIFSNSAIDARNIEPRHYADIRFTSKAFDFWHTFLKESLAEVSEYNVSGKNFDDKLRQSFVRRQSDFERQLKSEFAGGSMQDLVRLDQSNIVGFMTGVSGSVALGSDLLSSAGLGAGAVAAEKLAAIIRSLSHREARQLITSHYHAIAPL
ncbi:hypothetical protein [Roseobacter sp. A03A-229]